MTYRTNKGRRGGVLPDVVAAVLAVVGLAFGFWVAVGRRPVMTPARSSAARIPAVSTPAARTPAPMASSRAPVAAASANPGAAVLTPDKLFATASPSVVRIVQLRGKDEFSQGSGFFVSADGLMVTNFHVIDGNTSLKAFTSQGEALVVENVVATDDPGDLALLKIKAKPSGGYPFLLLAEAVPAVGVRVYAIGNPLGYSNTLSEGLVSGLRKGRVTRGEPNYVQTTAPISHGSSGGPLLSDAGEVVGVTTAMRVDGQNMNFAVEVGRVRRLVEDRQSIAMDAQSKARQWMGRAISEVLEGRRQPDGTYRAIAEALADAGEREDCEKVLDLWAQAGNLGGGGTPDERPRQIETAAIRARMGDLDGARRGAAELTGSLPRVMAYVRAAEVLGEKNNRPAARDMLKLAAAEVEQISVSAQREDTCLFLSAAQSRWGDYGGARRMAEVLKDRAEPDLNAAGASTPRQRRNTRSLALATLAMYEAQGGKLREAWELSDGVYDRFSRWSAELEVTRAAVAAGELKLAEDFAGKMDMNGPKPYARLALAEGYVKAGDVPRAREAIKAARAAGSQLQDAGSRASFSERLAGSLAAAGDLGGAEQVADAIGLPAWRGATYATLAVARARRGEWAQANDMLAKARQAIGIRTPAGRLGEAPDQVEAALAEVASLQAAADIKGASKLAAMMRPGAKRSEAFRAIGRIAAGESDAAEVDAWAAKVLLRQDRSMAYVGAAAGLMARDRQAKVVGDGTIQEAGAGE